jgi:hypothetical protein
MGTMNSKPSSKLHGLNTYQRTELRQLTNKGWTVVRIRFHADKMNPWSTVEVTDPRGRSSNVVLPVSKREHDYTTRTTN